MLGFCVLSLKRLASLPETGFRELGLTAVGLVWLPIFLLIWKHCRPWYCRHRQPIVFIRKAVAVAIGSTYTSSFYSSMHVAAHGSSGAPWLSLFMSSLGIASQILTHSLGFPNYANWHLASQAVGTVLAFKTSTIMCQSELSETLALVVKSLPETEGFSHFKARVQAEPQLACCIYCIFLHITVGFVAATVISNLIEFRQRRKFYASRFPNREPLTPSDLHHKEWVNVLLILIMHIMKEALNTAVDMSTKATQQVKILEK